MFNTFRFRKMWQSGVSVPCLINFFYWFLMFPRVSSKFFQYAFQQSLLLVSIQDMSKIVKMPITISQEQVTQVFKLCPACVQPTVQNVKVIHCTKIRHLRWRKTIWKSHRSFTGNISTWWFHIVSVCTVIYGNKWNAPQNNHCTQICLCQQF